MSTTIAHLLSPNKMTEPRDPDNAINENIEIIHVNIAKIEDKPRSKNTNKSQRKHLKRNQQRKKGKKRTRQKTKRKNTYLLNNKSFGRSCGGEKSKSSSCVDENTKIQSYVNNNNNEEGVYGDNYQFQCGDIEQLTRNVDDEWSNIVKFPDFNALDRLSIAVASKVNEYEIQYSPNGDNDVIFDQYNLKNGDNDVVFDTYHHNIDTYLRSNNSSLLERPSYERELERISLEDEIKYNPSHKDIYDRVQTDKKALLYNQHELLQRKCRQRRISPPSHKFNIHTVKSKKPKKSLVVFKGLFSPLNL